MAVLSWRTKSLFTTSKRAALSLSLSSYRWSDVTFDYTASLDSQVKIRSIRSCNCQSRGTSRALKYLLYWSTQCPSSSTPPEVYDAERLYARGVLLKWLALPARTASLNVELCICLWERLDVFPTFSFFRALVAHAVSSVSLTPLSFRANYFCKSFFFFLFRPSSKCFNATRPRSDCLQSAGNFQAGSRRERTFFQDYIYNTSLGRFLITFSLGGFMMVRSVTWQSHPSVY